MMKKRSRDSILEFQKPYRWLSNFHPVDIVDKNGMFYPSVEHAYQGAKCALASDRELIRWAPTPNEAKKRGRRVKIRTGWDLVKNEVMYRILQQKFAKDPLRSMLIDTGDMYLREGNYWHDNYWGVCCCSRCSASNNITHNFLGVLIMQVRSELIHS